MNINIFDDVAPSVCYKVFYHEAGVSTVFRNLFFCSSKLHSIAFRQTLQWQPQMWHSNFYRSCVITSCFVQAWECCQRVSEILCFVFMFVSVILLFSFMSSTAKGYDGLLRDHQCCVIVNDARISSWFALVTGLTGVTAGPASSFLRHHR